MREEHIVEYMARVQTVYATGETTEHSFRPALQFLFDGITKDVNCINEPKMVTDVGRPDFVFKRALGQQLITVGHCEAKDIDKDINPRAMKAGSTNKNQFDRYVKGLPNLIYTNGLDFRFYVNGELIREISIADFSVGIVPHPSRYHALTAALKDFAKQRVQTITSAKALAEMMASKAILIKTVLANSLIEDEDKETELYGQYQAFKTQLIHDLTSENFADIYAETIAYGMFAARLHDTETPEDFSREEALELLPKSNPFLRKLFSYVAGPELDERLRRDVDELAEIFQAVNLQNLFEYSGTENQRKDPFIHFYETFLAEYNPKKRKARGVWYTPEPVVNFIVRAVDDVLKSEFNLSDGLADTSKITVKVDTGQTDKKGKAKFENREMHRVQILDPATGTGTFLAEVIRRIAPKIKDIAPAAWSKYVEDDLIPRLHGFELLMASYAMCHMKLDMMLTDMGYRPTGKNTPRLNVFLTNSLEEGEREDRDLFSMTKWLSDEARGANAVKRDKPIMCIIGNPPYSVSSTNKSPFIEKLVKDYKKNLNERNIQPLSDDYIKFIRLSQHLIEKNGEGVLAFITNNSYLDGLIHRQMRKYLLEGFNKIYVVDLHGSSKKKERAPDGSADKNVFDIMQGVSIIVAVKTKNENKKGVLAKVKHLDVWGARKAKNEKLFDLSLKQRALKKIVTPTPNYFFVPKTFNEQGLYEKGFSIAKFMSNNICGLTTGRDKFLINYSVKSAESTKSDLMKLDEDAFRKKYGGVKDSRDWTLNAAKIDASRSIVKPIIYRPLDTRYVPYTSASKGILQYPRHSIMRHMITGENLGFSIPKQAYEEVGGLVTNMMIGHKSFSAYNRNYLFPLYLYPDESDGQSTTESRTVNMDPKIRAQIEKAATFSLSSRPSRDSGAEPGPQTVGQSKRSRVKPGMTGNVPDEVAIFDYIYGVLHCPAYRDTYKEFLKIDFPRVPYPSSPQSFWDISNKGTALRKLHLMQDAAIGDTPYRFEGDGDSVVEKPVFEPTTSCHPGQAKRRAGTSHAQQTTRSRVKPGMTVELGRVFINKTQYFDDVPKTAWAFYIGGYQPAQKWLKDRKGRPLSFDDIRHYQKIIKILSETDRIMKTISMDLGDAK